MDLLFKNKAFKLFKHILLYFLIEFNLITVNIWNNGQMGEIHFIKMIFLDLYLCSAAFRH